MKIAVMQPYFFPYLGYFQLINYADVFVNLDHVSFMKSSYMTRNTIKNNTPINIGVLKASQNKRCKDVLIDPNEFWIGKFKRKLELNYGNSEYFNLVYDEIIGPWTEFIVSENRPSISMANSVSTLLVMRYLGITTKYIDSSEGVTDNKSARGQIDIVKHFGGETYVNPVGGKHLYQRDYFLDLGLNLEFLEMEKTHIDEPNLSILHHLCTRERQLVQQSLKNYKIL